MKCFSLRPFIALVTFIIGISVVAFWFFRTNSEQITNAVIAQSKDEPATNKSAWKTFLSFSNQDLRKLDRQQKDKLHETVDALVGKTTDTGDLRLISKISNERGQFNYILIGESPLLTIPGNSGLRIQLFNPEGKRLNSISFDSGWRIDLTDIEIKYSPEIEREIIVVGSEPVINGRDVAKQYYALIDEEILLIRLEDSKGQPIRNVYGAPNYIIGLNKTGRSAEEWQKALESNDTAEVLAALSWLNGTHWNPQQNQTEKFYESINEAKLVEKVRSDNNTKERINTLSQSKNLWFKDAVNLSIKYEYYR